MPPTPPVTYLYTAADFALPLVIVAGLLVLAAVQARRGRRVQAVLVGLLALLTGGFLGAALGTARVDLDADRVCQVTYVPLGRRVVGFRFGDVRTVMIRTERPFRGPDDTLWVLHGHDGTTRTLNPGDLWDAHQADILDAFERYKAAES